MKCKYCGAELPNGTNFCTNCGRDLRNLRKCVKCGEIIDDDATFCPFCGTEQPVYQEDNSSKTKLYWIIPIVVVIAAAVGAFLYLHRDKAPEPVNTSTTMPPADSDTTVISPPYDVDTTAQSSDDENNTETDESEDESNSDTYNMSYFNYLSERDITEDDLQSFMSTFNISSRQDACNYLRNAIYAVHGLQFGKEAYSSFFSQFEGYSPSRSEVPYSELNDYERNNIQTLKDAQ